MKLILFVIITLVPTLSSATEKIPDCTGAGAWPASMAHVHLKNDDLIDNNKVDFSKTKVTRLASERVKKNLHRQVHLVIFEEKTGGKIQVITVSDASMEECSMGDVQVFVISKRLGP